MSGPLLLGKSRGVEHNLSEQERPEEQLRQELVAGLGRVRSELSTQRAAAPVPPRLPPPSRAGVSHSTMLQQRLHRTNLP